MFKLIKSKKAILVAAIVALLGYAGYQVAEQDVSKAVDSVITSVEKVQTELDQKTSIPPKEPPRVTENFTQGSHISFERRNHILYGDATGGGHLHGQGKPCKSEFPKHWDEQTIIREVDLIAANDNLNWEQQSNSYYVTEQKVGTVKVRVVKARNGEDVITAYPTNVTRNPCPANDN